MATLSELEAMKKVLNKINNNPEYLVELKQKYNSNPSDLKCDEIMTLEQFYLSGEEVKDLRYDYPSLQRVIY